MLLKHIIGVICKGGYACSGLLILYGILGEVDNLFKASVIVNVVHSIFVITDESYVDETRVWRNKL